MTGRAAAALDAPDFARDSVDHFAYRVLRDAWLDATAAYWRRRAQTFLDARPRPGDYRRNVDRRELRAQWDRLTASAAACLARAEYLEATRVEFDQVLADVGGGGDR